MDDDRATPDPTGDKQHCGRFQPGRSGNPSGRPVGARNKLSEAFLSALQKDFEEHGIAAIATVREQKPDQYLKIIASLVSRETALSVTDDFSDLTDDELVERLREITDDIALKAQLLTDRQDPDGLARSSGKPN